MLTCMLISRAATLFYALASLPRRRIIAFLSQTALSTADLAERFADEPAGDLAPPRRCWSAPAWSAASARASACFTA